MSATFDDRSRLIYLSYQVLTGFALPIEGKSDAEVYSLLARAFEARAAVVEFEAARKLQRGKDLLPETFYLKRG